MNISRSEQRVLHVLALGGRIQHLREGGPKITSVTCFTREGLVLADCNLAVFARMRRKRLIESRLGGAYRISRLGRQSVRAQHDNQGK
ncbi:YjhX family toxin [Rhodobacter sp.]